MKKRWRWPMIRGPRFCAVSVTLSLCLACLPVFGEESALIKETSLRSEPGSGERTAFVTPDTPIEVLELREGWVRVRIEGWVPADAVAAALSPRTVPQQTPDTEPPPPPPVTPPPAPATAPPTTIARPPAPAPANLTAPAGVPVEGLIKVKLSRLKKKVAAGAPVMLVPATVGMGQGLMTPETAKRLADLEAEAARLQGDIEKAMQMSNFTEATQRRDELRRERNGILDERLLVLAAEHGRNEHTARAAAVASGIADSKGFFRMTSVPPGAYTLYARMSGDDVDLEWIEPVDIGSAALRVDLDETTARGMMPKKK